jgi:hypothetical protein
MMADPAVSVLGEAGNSLPDVLFGAKIKGIMAQLEQSGDKEYRSGPGIIDPGFGASLCFALSELLPEEAPDNWLFDVGYPLFEAYLDCNNSAVVTKLTAKDERPWILRTLNPIGSPSMPLYDYVAFPYKEDAIGGLLEAVDTRGSRVSHVSVTEDSGLAVWAGDTVLAECMEAQFDAVDPELLARCQKVFKNVPRGTPEVAQKRAYELPGLRHCKPPGGITPKHFNVRHPQRPWMVEPSDLVTGTTRMATELGVSLSAAQARLLVANLLGYPSWQHLTGRWNRIEARCIYQTQNYTGKKPMLAPDAYHALAHLDMMVRQYLKTSTATLELELSPSFMPGEVFANVSHAGPEAVQPLVGATAALDVRGTHRAYADAGTRLARYRGTPLQTAVETELQLAASREEQLVARDARRSYLPAITSHGLRFTRTVPGYGGNAMFCIEAVTDAGDVTPAKDILRSRFEIQDFVSDAIYKTNAYFQDGNLTVCVDYDRKVVAFIQGVSATTAIELADALGLSINGITRARVYEEKDCPPAYFRRQQGN